MFIFALIKKFFINPNQIEVKYSMIIFVPPPIQLGLEYTLLSQFTFTDNDFGLRAFIFVYNSARIFHILIVPIIIKFLKA